MSKALRILQLYPRNMNIYGDWGNTLVLSKRAAWHGYDVELLSYDPGEEFPADVDLVVGGGGQDSGQSVVQEDLLERGPALIELAAAGTPMLVVCGLYQLFGHAFHTHKGEVIHGISLLDVETRAQPKRLIGNIVTESPDFGQIVGYENHSGLTTLGPAASPLGKVIKGEGNNGTDGTEGARQHHVIGTYLHGSVLPKNPRIADYLIQQAAIKRHGEFTPAAIDDSLAEQARAVAVTRPR